jgi:acyl-CoA thioester hydrolase
MASDTSNILPMLIEKDISIYMYDIDVMGIVNNIVYIRWFEDLRTCFLDRFCPLQEMLRDGIAPVLLQTTVQYRSPLTIHDRPKGRIWVDEMGKARWRVALDISVGDRICCEGIQEGSVIDLSTKRPVRLPKTLIDQYRQECVSDSTANRNAACR